MCLLLFPSSVEVWWAEEMQLEVSEGGNFGRGPTCRCAFSHKLNKTQPILKLLFHCSLFAPWRSLKHPVTSSCSGAAAPQ